MATPQRPSGNAWISTLYHAAFERLSTPYPRRALTSPPGTIVRVAGSGEKGTAGIGGPADKLQLNQPHGVCFDKSGVLHIVDSKNHRVLKLVE